MRNLLTDQMNNVERQCCANSQYSGSKCLEVVGIPSSVNIKDLEGKVCIVFNRIGPAIKAHGIEAYHRL